MPLYHETLPSGGRSLHSGSNTSTIFFCTDRIPRIDIESQPATFDRSRADVCYRQRFERSTIPAYANPYHETLVCFQELPGYFPNKKNIWDVFEKPSGGTFTTTETYNTTYGPFAIQYYKSAAP